MEYMTEEIWENTEIYAPKGCLYRISVLSKDFAKKMKAKPFVYVSNGIPQSNNNEIIRIDLEGNILNTEHLQISDSDLIKIKKFIIENKEVINKRWNGLLTTMQLFQKNNEYQKSWDEI